MAIRVVRLGTPRLPGEGPRLGTVRRPPRGVKKTDYARRDYFDVWLPELAPSAPLVKTARAEGASPRSWKGFARRYLAEMRQPRARHLLETLAALSRQTDFSVGCYCADETHCHRSLLRGLLIASGAIVKER